MKRGAYWAATGVVLLVMGGGGVVDVLRTESTRATIRHLGFPDWFPLLLGSAKLLGTLALAAPGLARLKEWAYAGFTINLVSAAVAHIAVGDPIFRIAVPAGLLIPLAASYVLWRRGARGDARV